MDVDLTLYTLSAIVGSIGTAILLAAMLAIIVDFNRHVHLFGTIRLVRVTSQGIELSIMVGHKEFVLVAPSRYYEEEQQITINFLKNEPNMIRVGYSRTRTVFITMLFFASIFYAIAFMLFLAPILKNQQ